MTKKTIFFDLDGTLIGPWNGNAYDVPECSRAALAALKEAGHTLAVCSGRQKSFAELYFPGIFSHFIAMSGTYVICFDKTIYQFQFSSEQVMQLMERFDRYGACYNFVGEEKGWARNIPPHRFQSVSELYGLGDYLIQDWNPQDVKAGMIDFLFTDEAHYRSCLPAFDDDMVLNIHADITLPADLSFRGRDKSTGIKLLMEHIGITPEEIVAFGDGINDISMLKLAGCGVAMGNGMEEAKRAADYVTGDMYDGGILSACGHLGLL